MENIGGPGASQRVIIDFVKAYICPIYGMY